MKKEQYWLNFCLGHELANAGGFIYNGVKFLETLRNLAEYSLIYESLYNLSIGFER